MTYHPLLAVLLLVTTAFQLPAQRDSVKKIKPPTPLFASDDPISIQLTADFKAIFKDRDTTEQKWHPAAFTWKAGADSGSAAVELTTRGHFRLKSSTCSFPMLRVRFPKDLILEKQPGDPEHRRGAEAGLRAQFLPGARRAGGQLGQDQRSMASLGAWGYFTHLK